MILLFQNGKLKVRKLEEKDKSLLTKWLSDPLVLEYYEGRDNPFDLDKVMEVFFHSKNEEIKCIVEFDCKEIGYIQFYQLEDEMIKELGYINENVYGTDQFIGEVGYWNKGIGTLLVKTTVNYLIEHKKADRVVMDPQIRNTRAIKCYVNCGFKTVKVLTNHELHEGEYQDCLLLEYQN
ncbi:GNAT family N-acetyltransferase [Metabacillus litoralis]|uniref:GNAT family N-acetyltransferase n=1 Tax=Metabacillus litoralis TaxID=152268 RepID=UPI001CFDA816|nr:GNAT family N-acetyltransferase [Metabacillus litoralis]